MNCKRKEKGCVKGSETLQKQDKGVFIPTGRRFVARKSSKANSEPIPVEEVGTEGDGHTQANLVDTTKKIHKVITNVVNENTILVTILQPSNLKLENTNLVLIPQPQHSDKEVEVSSESEFVDATQLVDFVPETQLEARHKKQVTDFWKKVWDNMADHEDTGVDLLSRRISNLGLANNSSRLALRKLIQNNSPNFVFIVEPWMGFSKFPQTWWLRINLWQNLHNLISNNKIPWSFIDDFNAIISAEEYREVENVRKDIQHTISVSGYTQCLQVREAKDQHELEKALILEEFDKEKANMKWHTDGDRNTRFFHTYARIKRKNNMISSLNFNDVVTTDHNIIENHLVKHFTNLFNKLVKKDTNALLTLIPSAEEIHNVVRNLKSDSAPCMDDFGSIFLHKYWNIIKEDVTKVVTQFFLQDWLLLNYNSNTIILIPKNRKLVKSISSAFIALIPKNQNPQDLSEYRPICLVGSLYKILSKMLVARIKKVLGSLISCNQSAFVPGRNMLDGVLMVNEVIDWAKRNKLGCLLLKVDFEKAYHSLSWNFLRDLLVRMGFGKRWLMWMDACIFSSHLSVLVNGSATQDFKVHRGLRQGDPLSPFLFMIAMEALTAMVRNSVEGGNFKPFQLGNDEGVDILQFADDTVIFGEASTANLWNLKVILRGFELISGLKINFSKSRIMGVNVGDWILDAATKFLACKRGNFPFLFLGIMVGVNPRNKKVWSKVLDNFKKRLDTWKGRNISIGGQVTLINAVLNAIPSFTSKDKGGLGVRDVGEFNRALLLKWKWRFLKDDGAVWKSFVKWRYNNFRLKVFLPAGEGSNVKDSIWWRDVLSIDIFRDNAEEGFSSCVQCTANNGASISFWYSIWLGNQSLRTSISDLFDLSTKRYASVGDIVEWDNGTQRWKFESLFDSVFLFQVLNSEGGLQSANWKRFLDMVKSCLLVPSAEDGFEWIPIHEGVFSVASVAVLLEEHKEPAWGTVINRRLSTMWKSSVPLKIKIFAWRLLISRLPLKDMLLRRGLVANTIDPKCPFCDSLEESLEHLFFLCQISKNIWEKVLQWIGFSSGFLREALLGLDDIQFKVSKSSNWDKVNIIWLATTWSLWLMRNDNVFNNEPFSFETVFNRIVFLSWRWSESSVLFPRTSFYDWYKLPI
ncbi:uncharacterized protein LOC131629160 [Vicia villosa]|uniref:uncharacterized protein LOC131629160 n=1 Tax=Vicia villosa TaxID=3911 RepID=UPI00273C0EC4|nr:uncharacterized protein LOC131629160 [Vicia villosa]